MSAPYFDWLRSHPEGQLFKEQRGGGFVIGVGGKLLPEFRSADRRPLWPKPRLTIEEARRQLAEFEAIAFNG
jgi:hypothetical protein